MSTEGVLSDIVRQPESLSMVLDSHFGRGRAEMQRAAALIRDARAVILTGMGASLFACIPLEYSLASAGCQPVLVEAAELLHYQRLRCRDAVVVIVSRSGESVEIRKLLEALKNENVTIVGITNETDGYLAGAADVVLLVRNRPDEFVAVQGYTAQLATLLLLAAAVFYEPEAKVRKSYEAALAEMSVVIESCILEGDRARHFFEGASVIHLLGRGPSWGNCAEGALLFSEIAKLPAVAQFAGLFRHGPVEVAQSSFRGIVFAPEGKTRGLNLNLARDLRTFGSQVYIIGPLDGCDELPGWHVPASEQAFSRLLEIVPVQFAAWHAAQWRGVVPGEFRYVSRVTLDESRFEVQLA